MNSVKKNGAQTMIQGQSFNLPVDNVDTDQIIPARFLTTTEREGLGQYCFYSWRHGDEKNTLFDQYRQQPILVAGNNFGCGSSREHAPWALLDMGVRVVISSQIADIFRNNALKNGLLPVVVDQVANRYLLDHNHLQLTINIENRSMDIPGYGVVTFPLDSFSAYCLIHGMDSLDYLLQQQPQIHRYEERR